MSEVKSYVAFKREVLKRIPDAEVYRMAQHWGCTIRSGGFAVSGSWSLDALETVDEFCTGMVVSLDQCILEETANG